MSKVIEAYFRLLKILIVVCLAGMVLLVFGNVVLRYAFNSGITESEEFSRWLFVWMVFLGAIVVLRENGHLGLEFVVNSLPRPLRRICLGLAHVLMIFATWLIISGSYTQFLLNMHTYAPATGLPISFLVGVGLIFGVSTGAILVWRLYLIVVGRLDRVVTFDEKLQALQQSGVK